MKKNLKKGFTLTELVVVIVIIGILASVLIPTLTSYITRSRKSAAEQEANSRLQEAAAYVLDADNEAWFAWNEYLKGSKVEVKTSNDYYVVFDKGQLKTDLTKTTPSDAVALLTYTAATNTVAAYYLLTLDAAPTSLTEDSLSAKLESTLKFAAAGTTIYVVLYTNGVAFQSTVPTALTKS